MNFVRVTQGDIEIGKPLPWDVYDSGHHLLVTRGVVIESERQVGLLLEGGLLRKAAAGEAQAAVEADSHPERPVEETETALEEIRLEIGDTLQLQPQAEGDHVRHYVKLVGYLQGQNVLVTYPRVDGVLPPLHEGQGFVVRFFAGRCAYAFPARISTITTSPFPHLYLTYPSKVRGVAIRQGMRAHVRLSAKVTAPDGQAYPAAIADLSTGGALLHAKQVMGVWGEKVKLEFSVTIGKAEEHLQLEGTLRTLHAGGAADAEGATVKHGVQFVNVPHEEELALAAYVYQRLVEENPAG